MKIGLIFAGGGGKGAYQIGVWKAMEEFGFNADMVAGTSVGALNAALYIQGDLTTAINLWENINSGDVLSLNEGSELINFLNVKFKISSEKLTSVPEFLKQKGLFSQRGLKNMILQNIEFDKMIYTGPIDYFFDYKFVYE